MSSDEEEPGRPASYAARLTSFGEGRRSSFGAKLSPSVSEEGGKLDKALSMLMPSDQNMFKPFKVMTKATDQELIVAANEDEEVISEHIELSKELLRVSQLNAIDEIVKASKVFHEMSNEEILLKAKIRVNERDIAELRSSGEHGERNAHLTR